MMYPNLLKMVQLIGQDAGLTVRRNPVWPPESPAMELEAARLSDFEKDVVASDEVGNQEEIVAKHGIEKLHLWLNEVFDGYLTDNFYEDR